MYTPVIGMCVLAGCCIRDNGVAEKDAKKVDEGVVATQGLLQGAQGVRV